MTPEVHRVVTASRELAQGHLVVLVGGSDDRATLVGAASTLDEVAVGRLRAATTGPLTVVTTDRHVITPAFGSPADRPPGGGSAAAILRAARALQTGSGPLPASWSGLLCATQVDEGGVVVRPERSEASFDLGRITGLPTAVVTGTLLSEDGRRLAGRAETASIPSLQGLARVSVDDVVRYRQTAEPRPRPVTGSRLPTQWGTFTCLAIDRAGPPGHDLALVRGPIDGVDAVPVRVHRECPIGDLFGSRGCGCAGALHASLEVIGSAVAGVVLYLRAPPPTDPAEAPDGARQVLDDHGRLTSPDRVVAAQMLRSLGVRSVRLAGDSDGLALELQAHQIDTLGDPLAAAVDDGGGRASRTRVTGDALPSSRSVAEAASAEDGRPT